MSDNRTTELLREGLTERGIEWRSGLEGVTFVGDWCFVEYDNGRLAATCEPVLTPEQAIAATLGDEWDGKPFVEYAEHVAMELRNEAWALLEGCDEPDFSAIEAIYATCDDIVTIAGRWKRGESQDEAAALENSSDTAATLGSEREKALESLLRDWRACDPRCTNRSCGDCEHDEDDGCGLYRRMCELGVIA